MDIVFERLTALEKFACPATTVFITDNITKRFVPPAFDKIIIAPQGEAAKCLDALSAMYEGLLRYGADRNWMLIGLGGGSVLDAAGFAAATWMRGIDFCCVPTTLLAMTDAALGGKNGIDFMGYKNLIGTVREPRFALIDTTVLAALPQDELSAGLSEAVKHAVIAGESYMEYIEQALDDTGLIRFDALDEIIRRSIAVKRRYTEADMYEASSRRVLNLGHTFAHAAEAVAAGSGRVLKHGEAVAAGLVCAARFSENMYCEGESIAQRLTRLFSKLRLPTTIAELGLDRDALGRALYADKKRNGARIHFVFPRALGCVEVHDVAIETIADYIRRAP